MGQVVALAAAGPFQPPCPLGLHHDLSQFDCGKASLNDWLQRRALKNQTSHASRTYVVLRGDVVVGYYCLAAGSVALVEAAPGLRRNMPDPIPVMVLGRLGVQVTCKGNGVGPGMLRDAVMRTLQAAEIAGVAGLLVHALDEDAAGFYLKYGFKRSPINELTMMLTTREMARHPG